MMRMSRFIMADEILNPDDLAGGVIDLAEYAHPSARAAALERLAAARAAHQAAPLAIILPPDSDHADLDQVARLGTEFLVLNDAESGTQLAEAGNLLDRYDKATWSSLVARLTSGRGLDSAPELAGVHRRVGGLWYAVADLLVDFDDDPPMPYYFDAGESRLAAPAWTRSMLLTVCRAARIDLWGQLDLSFAAAPPEPRRHRAARLARLSGFDELVTRHPPADAAPEDG